jgi:hypothetical protein
MQLKQSVLRPSSALLPNNSMSYKYSSIDKDYNLDVVMFDNAFQSGSYMEVFDSNGT